MYWITFRYVRCIKPNMTKGSNAFDSQLVLDQLRYLGMLEIIRIRKQGFPVHYQFGEFLNKYHCLSVRNRKQKGLRLPANDERAAAKALLQAEGMPPMEWQIGKTKLFLRGCVHEPLEDRRLSIINAMATRIQKVWRGQRMRKDFLKKRSAAKMIQECYLTWRLRIRFLRQRRAAVVIQSHLRGMFAREVANALREAKRVEEERRRKELLEEERRKRQLEVEEERKRREAEAAAAAGENGDGTLGNREEVQGEAGEDTSFDRKKSFAGLADLDQGEAEKELQKLSQLAGQLNPKLNDASSHDHSANNVDLDQLFNFLSGEAASTIATESVAGSNSEAGGNRSSILDEIDRQMSDLQNEIDQYSIDEGMTNDAGGGSREMSPPPLPPPSALPAAVTQPPTMQLGKPSLPEPEGPPPPPPVQNGYAFNTPHLSQEVRNPLKINKQDANKPKEPIYESIKPRPEPVGGNEDPPPEPLPPPPPPQQQLPSAVVPPPIVTPLPPQSQRPQQSPDNSAGVYQSRQNKRQRRQQLQQQQQQQQQLQQQLPDPEREARRMERVKRGLEKIQEESNFGAGGGELFEEFSMLEFAENFFNDHEKCSPQSTIVGTLKRRGSKANLMDILSKEDMIQHFKGNAIPTSHIHLYDPENVNIAVKVFREVLKYSRGELKTADAEVTTIQNIIRHGIEVEELRDEIYVQCLRQLTNNPCEEQIQRLWLLLCLVVVAFTPSKAFFKVL